MSFKQQANQRGEQKTSVCKCERERKKDKREREEVLPGVCKVCEQEKEENEGAASN